MENKKSLSDKRKILHSEYRKYVSKVFMDMIAEQDRETVRRLKKQFCMSETLNCNCSRCITIEEIYGKDLM